MTIYACIYYYVLKPTVVIPYKSDVAQCPTKWAYDEIQKVCRPFYETDCLPFDPEAEIYKKPSAKCGVAKNCNTTWKGLTCAP